MNITRLCRLATLPSCAVAAETGMHQALQTSGLPGFADAFYAEFKGNLKQHQVFAVLVVLPSAPSSRWPFRIASTRKMSPPKRRTLL